MEGLLSLLGRNGLLPHGYCIQWAPKLLWSMVGADLLIALAYFSIPLAILSFVRRRGADLRAYGWLPWLFSAFIAACGLTHVMDVWVLWEPLYGLQTLAKLLTAGVSAATAVAMWPLIPRALAIPSVQQLQGVIAELQAEVGRRHSAEQHLLDIEQSLALTLSSIEAGFIATDRQGRITRMNAVAERLTGCTQEAARGQGLCTVLAPVEPPPAGDATGPHNPVDALLAECGSAPRVREAVALRGPGAGGELLVDLRQAVTRDAAGQVRGMVSLLRDVTDSLRTQAALRDSEERLRFALEAAQIGDWELDLRSGATQRSLRHDHCFGHCQPQPGWTVADQLRHVHPDDRDAVAASFQACVDSGQAWQAEFRVVWADGSVHWLAARASVQRAQQRVLGIVTDITAARRAEEARLLAQRLEVENQQIQASNRLKSQFLANMSHELRTPLNAIIGFADLLAAGKVPQGSPKHPAFLGHIASSGRHLLQLINDVLDLSKVEAGRLQFVPEPVQLPALLEEVTGVLHGELLRQRLRLHCEIDAGLDGLQLDPVRLKQALYNYLSNAIKFTPPGGSITVRALAEGPEQLRLEVEDTGIGIAEAELPRLFVEFQQLDAGIDKRHGGTGLGLALTRRLVQAQGGSVGVRSRPGQGSCFHLVLPRVVPAEPQPAGDGQAAVVPDARPVGALA